MGHFEICGLQPLALDSTNDHEWYKVDGHGRYSGVAPRLGEFYELKAIDSLWIDRPYATSEHDMNTPIAVAHQCLTDVLDLQLQLGLLAAPRLVDIRRPIDLQHRTCAPIETFQSALTVSTSLRLRAGLIAFLTARPGAWLCPMTGPPRSASAWHSPLRTGEDASSPRASGRRIFAPVVNVASEIPALRQISPIGVPSSTCFNMNAICTSEDFEAFIEFSSSSHQGS